MMMYITNFLAMTANMLDTTIETINKSIRAHRAYEELNNLTDRELSDLGLNRYDITRVAFESVQTRVFR